MNKNPMTNRFLFSRQVLSSLICMWPRPLPKSLICMLVKTVVVSNPGDVNLHKQIFVDIFWTIWPMWKICLGLIHAVNFHVKAATVFVGVMPLLVQKLPLSNNKLSMFLHCDPCSSFSSSLENNIIELGFWVSKNYSLSFGNT